MGPLPLRAAQVYFQVKQPSNQLYLPDPVKMRIVQFNSQYQNLCIRTPQEAITDTTEIAVSPKSLQSELTCPICLDMLTSTMTTKECLHRWAKLI